MSAKLVVKFPSEKEYNYFCMALDVINMHVRKPIGYDPLTLKQFAANCCLHYASRILQDFQDQIKKAEVETTGENGVNEEIESNDVDTVQTDENVETNTESASDVLDIDSDTGEAPEADTDSSDGDAGAGEAGGE